MKKHLLTAVLALCLSTLNLLPASAQAQKTTQPEKRDYYRLVVASDIHYPTKFNAKRKPLEIARTIYHKKQAVKDINSWQDVDLVVFTGDMISRIGDENSFSEASSFTDTITQPKAFITGNHEFFYSAKLSKKNKVKKAKPQEREILANRFKTYFKTPELYYTKTMGDYLLIFLSPDNNQAKYPTEMSQTELDWFKATLEANKNKPTIAFFHGPLKGTLFTYTKKVNGPNYIAQPAEKLAEIIKANPQLKLWVSGHTHTDPTNPSFANKVNWFEGQVLDVHNPSWEGKQVWTNSLYLYPHKIMIKTYDHKEHKFVDSLTRKVKI